jgi:hypothetical protein
MGRVEMGTEQKWLLLNVAHQLLLNVAQQLL